MEQTNFTDKERKKIIFISAGLVALILILVVTSIIVTVNRTNNAEIATAGEDEIVTVDAGVKEEEKKEESKEAPKEEKKTSVTPKTTETTDTIADTGPEDLLPLAMLGGSLTTFLVSLYLTKKA